jgi:acid phosphatase
LSVTSLPCYNGIMTRDGQVTPDGFAVNTSYSINNPHPATATALVPLQTVPTIGDRLSDRGISWVWYSGGWETALLGHADPLFQFHHQPFAYYANFADGTAAKAEHLRDEVAFYNDVAAATLPAVSFIKPLGPDNEHPGYATLSHGQVHVADLVSAVQNSQYWNDTAIIITYDEHGGRWDHVPPPVIDRWGPGLRVPTIVISPFARKGFVDHTQYDTTAILKLIETRWKLEPLGDRDANSGNMLTAFDFNQG